MRIRMARGWHTPSGCKKKAPDLRKDWCPRQDSNLRPSAPEADALSPELRGRTMRNTAPMGFDSLTHRRRRKRIRGADHPRP